MEITTVLAAMGVVRIAIGAGPLFTPRQGFELLGFPPEHDNPTARVMGRLFGVRDIGLGVMILMALDYPAWLGFVCLFNAAHDVGDALSFAVPLIRRQGIDRGAGIGCAIASSAVGAWLLVWSML